MAALTLNQILDRLRTLSLSHQQINSFYFGSVPEFDANGDINYPACFIEQLTGSIDRSQHLQTYGFRIYMLDRVLVSEDTEGNEQEVLSDRHSVASDFMAMLTYYDDMGDWQVGTLAGATPVTEQLNDMVAGVYLDVTISVDYIADRCQVPAEDVTFEDDFDMARTKILTYTGTGSEGASFTVSGLAGKNVLAVYRAGGYKRAIVTTPTDSDSIRVTGTDLGSNKGILSTDGNVRLSSGDFLVANEILDFLIWSE